jgi:hypothetical protein
MPVVRIQMHGKVYVLPANISHHHTDVERIWLQHSVKRHRHPVPFGPVLYQLTIPPKLAISICQYCYPSCGSSSLADGTAGCVA